MGEAIASAALISPQPFNALSFQRKTRIEISIRVFRNFYPADAV
jgi:hypothetical protein